MRFRSRPERGQGPRSEIPNSKKKLAQKWLVYGLVQFCKLWRQTQAARFKCLLLLCLWPLAARAAIGPPPLITLQPLDQTALKGSTATFSVVAVSGTTMTYQWRQNGNIIPTATQSTYSLKAQYDGVFSVDIMNGSGTVTSSNAALHVVLKPDASNDRYNVLQDHSLVVPAPGVLANDTDPNGLLLTAVLGTLPTHGTLVLSIDGSFTYVPAPGFYGNDSFTYSATDPLVGSSTAMVTLKVQQIIDQPLTLSTTGMGTNGFQIKLTGPAPATYIVEVSNDLQKWTTLSTTTVTSGSLQVTDTTASSSPSRFYRAIAQKSW